MSPDLVKVPKGDYMMGTQDSPEMAPLVRMIISKPFWMSRTLITQKQWYWVMRTKPWKTDDEDVMDAEGFVEHDDCPAVCVSKVEAEQFIDKLSKKTKKKYALPTDVQWEYAYRAGTRNKYFWGDNSDGYYDYAWCCDYNKPRPKNLCLQPVGKLKANPWGLFDMAGLVVEWVRDRVKSKELGLAQGHYPNNAVDFWSQEGPAAILRNGPYFSSISSTSATFKYLRLPKAKSNCWGFRVVCEER